MVFKRRDRRGIWRTLSDLVYPRGGWARAFEYVKHRVRRLPDTPEKISRGIAAGVFTSFTPLYGMHFIVAALIAHVMRGNILASLLATFFGNPLTYVPIAVASLGTGYWMLGIPLNASLFGLGHAADPNYCTLGCRFGNAFYDIGHNFMAIFTHERVDWRGLIEFHHEVFYPYLIGCIIPGAVSAAVCYFISVPVIGAYQKRRRKVLQERLAKLTKKADPANDMGL